MAITQNASFSFRLTPSQVFNLFLTEIANTKTIPVNLSYLKPNAETLRAMQEAENGDVDIISEANFEANIMENLLKSVK